MQENKNWEMKLGFHISLLPATGYKGASYKELLATQDNKGEIPKIPS